MPVKVLGTVQKLGLHQSHKWWRHKGRSAWRKEGGKGGDGSLEFDVLAYRRWLGFICCCFRFRIPVGHYREAVFSSSQCVKVCLCVLEDFCNEIRDWSGGFHVSFHWLLSLNLSHQVSYSLVLFCYLYLHITYDASGTVLNAVQITTISLILTSLQFRYNPHFIDLDTEAQRC